MKNKLGRVNFVKLFTLASGIDMSVTCAKSYEPEMYILECVTVYTVNEGIEFNEDGFPNTSMIKVHIPVGFDPMDMDKALQAFDQVRAEELHAIMVKLKETVKTKGSHGEGTDDSGALEAFGDALNLDAKNFDTSFEVRSAGAVH